MATIYKRLSSKVNKETKLSEVLLSLKNGNDYFVRGKSGIFITVDNFKKGEIVVNRRKLNNDITYHEEQEKRMGELCTYIMRQAIQTSKKDIRGKWLQYVIDAWHGGAPLYASNTPSMLTTKKPHTFIDYVAEYFRLKKCSSRYKVCCMSVFRAVYRFEAYMKAVCNKKYTFDVHKITRHDLERLVEYMSKENELLNKHPDLYKQIIDNMPPELGNTGRGDYKRGENSIVFYMSAVKTFFIWLVETERTKNRPFDGFKFGREQYGKPYYITIEERNHIAGIDLSNDKHLEICRDLFIFQCLVGCRVGDLMRLTKDNIINGFLVYSPHKTKNHGGVTNVARIPLHEMAQALIKKYEGQTGDHNLFSAVPLKSYNAEIKKIFTMAGITRNVVVRNSLTGEPESVPINTVASSHLARRTFIGNAYSKVRDPNIIGKMSGHVDGSKAFARYRNIDDDALIDVIKQI